MYMFFNHSHANYCNIFCKGTLINRTEDSIIAWTWKQFMDMDPDEEDPEILLRFPMCKVSVLEYLDKMNCGAYSKSDRHIMFL